MIQQFVPHRFRLFERRLASLALCCWAAAVAAPLGLAVAGPIETVPGMPPVVDPTNLYSETAAGKFSLPSPGHCRGSMSPTGSRATFS